MLGQRIITALILLPLVIWGVLKLDSVVFASIIGAILMLGGTEWCRLAGLAKPLQQAGFLLILAVSLWLGWHYIDDARVVTAILWLALAWWLASLVWVLAYPRGQSIWYGPRLLRALAGLLVLVPTFVALVSLQAQPLYGPERVLYLMVLIWVADSGAYFTGRSLGRHKLAPKVSPGKSWEGVLGGLLASVLAAWLIADWRDLGLHFDVTSAVAIAVLILFSVLGDLTESMYKRHAGVKDSGSLLPGHGGVLDRLDSLTSASPIFLLVLTLGWL